MTRKRQAPPPPPPKRRSPRAWPARAWVLGAAAAIVVAVGLGLGLGLTGGAGTHEKAAQPLPLAPLSTLGTLKPAPSPGPQGPEGVPVPGAPALAPAAAIAPGAAIDGIECQPMEQVLFHIHAHLTLFVNGAARQIPYGIGIAPPREVQQTPVGPFVAGGACFAWLHTHAADGIIHIESPVRRTYTLGNFFDIWHQPLGTTRLGPLDGHVTALFNGQVYEGNPRQIPLRAHAQIQLELGRPLVAPEKVGFPNGL
jgi:hypothetical protein